LDEASPRTKGARRCANPACEYGNRWVVGKMRLLRNGKFSCLGKGCHTIYEPREVIDPSSDDFGIYTRRGCGT
jgi:hypothetical protein